MPILVSKNTLTQSSHHRKLLGVDAAAGRPTSELLRRGQDPGAVLPHGMVLVKGFVSVQEGGFVCCDTLGVRNQLTQLLAIAVGATSYVNLK